MTLSCLVFALAGPVASQQAGPAASEAVQPPAEMTQYYFVFLRRGPAWTAVMTPEVRAVSEGHMANINRLTESGQMVVAGPFLGQTGDRALAGLFILRAESAAAADALVRSDPAVVAGRFVYEIVPWLGPNTLGF